MAPTKRGEGGNLYLTVTPIAYEALMRLNDALLIPKLISRDYEEYFADKIGDTVSVKKPYYGETYSGRDLSAQQEKISKMIDRTIDVKVDTWNGFALKWNGLELTLDIKDFGDRYLRSGLEDLAHLFDENCGKTLSYGAYYMDGTPGTQSTYADTQDVLAHADYISMPQTTQRFALLDPYDIAAFTKELQGTAAKTVYNEEFVREAIQRQYMGDMAGFRTYQSTNLETMDVLPASKTGTPLVAASGGYEGNMLPTDGWPSSQQKILNRGQLIKIGSAAATRGIIQEITRRGTKKLTGNDMTFTVTADVSSAADGTATIPIEPEINGGTLTTTDKDGNSVSLAAFKNVNRKAFDNEAITVLGDSGKSYRQSIWFVPECATRINVMITPLRSYEADGNAFMAYDEQTGLSITVQRDAEILPLTEMIRGDTFFGSGMIYPDVAMRLLSAAR